MKNVLDVAAYLVSRSGDGFENLEDNDDDDDDDDDEERLE